MPQRESSGMFECHDWVSQLIVTKSVMIEDLTKCHNWISWLDLIHPIPWLGLFIVILWYDLDSPIVWSNWIILICWFYLIHFIRNVLTFVSLWKVVKDTPNNTPDNIIGQDQISHQIYEYSKSLYSRYQLLCWPPPVHKLLYSYLILANSCK